MERGDSSGDWERDVGGKGTGSPYPPKKSK